MEASAHNSYKLQRHGLLSSAAVQRVYCSAAACAVAAAVEQHAGAVADLLLHLAVCCAAANVNELFMDIARKLPKAEAVNPQQAGRQGNVVLTDASQQAAQRPKGMCC